MAHDVFICHSSKDRTIANAICSKLEQHRIRCWIAPRDVLPGSDYAESIIEALSVTRLTVLVFSENSNKSQHVHREIERAVGHGVPILPFRVDDVVPSPSLEYFISNAHWLDAMTPPLDKHLDHLVGTVRLLLDRAEDGHPQADEAAAAAPPPVARKRVPAWGWAVLSLAVVAVAALVAALTMGGGGRGGTPTPGMTSAAPVTAAAKLGTAFNLTGIDSGTKASVKALSYVDPTTSTGEAPSPGNRFIAVRFEVKNVGATSYEDALDNCSRLIDTAGHEFSATTVLSVAAGPLFPTTVTMKPGETLVGYTVFDIPMGAKISRIRFSLDSANADTFAEWETH